MNSRLPPRIQYALGCALVLSLAPRSTFAQLNETPPLAAKHTIEVASPSTTPARATEHTAEVASPAATPAHAATYTGDITPPSVRDTHPPSREPIKTRGASRAPSNHTGVVNLNTATAAELERLPRIGPSRAQAILELRAKLTRFSTVEQLLRVKGIGRATFRKLRPMLVVEGPTTLPERTAR